VPWGSTEEMSIAERSKAAPMTPRREDFAGCQVS